MDTISVVVIEDHPIFLDALVGYLKSASDTIEFVGSASNYDRAIELVRDESPEVALLDLALEDSPKEPEKGLELIRKIRTISPEIKVIVITGFDESLFGAIQAGAFSFLTKQQLKPAEVVNVIKEANNGLPRIDARIANGILEYMKESPDMLTPREYEVVSLASQGLTNKEIAERLSISWKTVKRHLQNIYAKTHIRNRVELALLERSERRRRK